MTAATTGISYILSQLINTAGISEAELGRIINVPRATINRLASGRTPDPRAATLQVIAEYFDVSVDQLLGRQPIFSAAKKVLRSSAHASIPVLDWCNANNWKILLKKLNPANHLDWILTDQDMENGRFALRVTGDSMWPQFQEKTLLIIDPEQIPKNRDFVIARINKSNEILFRQLSIDGKYKFVRAINEIFPAIQMKDCDSILGVVIQTRNNLG